jgi:crotonobetainyl-CoA:carnitine CoA-transferase CaiB-like acyl-CoA transferase
LGTGQNPVRRGNGHPNIVPYSVFGTSDGHVIIAVGNDSQFQRFCTFLGLDHLPSDERFATNPARIVNRDALTEAIAPGLASRTTLDVVVGLEAVKVPVGPVQTLDEVFTSDQVAARDMVVEMPDDSVQDGKLRLIGNPLKLSRTPVSYRRKPPSFGQDTEAVLGNISKKKR